MRNINKLTANPTKVLSAVIGLVVAATIALGGHASAPPASANHNDNTEGVVGIHVCGYAIVDNSLQVQGHVIQVRWGATTDPDFDNVVVKLTTDVTGENHIGGMHTGSTGGGVHQFTRILQNDWPERTDSGMNDYWIYYIWTIPMDGDTEGDAEYGVVGIGENGQRSCLRGFGETTAPPVAVPGSVAADAYRPPPTPSKPSAPSALGIELLDSGHNEGDIRVTWNTAPASEQVTFYRVWRRVSNNLYSNYFNLVGDIVTHEYPSHEGDDNSTHDDLSEGDPHNIPSDGRHAHRGEGLHTHTHSHPHVLAYIDTDTAKTSVIYEYQVKAWNKAGNGPASEIVSVRKNTPVNHPPTGKPVIDGRRYAGGNTLTADTGLIQDRNGMQNASFTYRWERFEFGDSGRQDIGTGLTYDTTDDDAGKFLGVVVSYGDDDGYAADQNTVASTPVYIEHDDPMVVVIDAQDSHDGSSFEFGLVFTEPPELDFARIRRAVNISGATITGARELWPTEWVVNASPRQRDVTITIEETPLFSCNSNTVICSRETSGKRLVQGDTKTVPYEATEEQTAQNEPKDTGGEPESGSKSKSSNSPATGKPTILGTARIDEELYVNIQPVDDPNGMDQATLNYQWTRDTGSGHADITDATGSSYTVVSADSNHHIGVKISFTDEEEFEETVTSDPVHVTPPPLTGAFDTSTVPASHDGQNAFTFQLRFSEGPTLSPTNVRDHVLTVTNGDVTEARRTTPGEAIRWENTLEPDSDDDVTVVLSPTTDCAQNSAVCTEAGKMLSNQSSITVRGPTAEENTEQGNQQSQPPEAPTDLTASLDSDGSITLSWTAPAGEVTGYQILRRRPHEGENTLLVPFPDRFVNAGKLPLTLDS